MTCTCPRCTGLEARIDAVMLQAADLGCHLACRETPGAFPVLDADSYVVFQVQALLYTDRNGPHRWSSCYAHAYRDVETECRMIQSPAFKPLLEHPSRVTWGNGWGPARSLNEGLAFTEVGAAVALHERMNGVVAWNSDWEASQPWHIEGRKRRAQTRVVELRMASSTRLVTAGVG